MTTPHLLTDTRYTPIGRYWQHLFGEKVYKISVSVAETCPVRGGDGGAICIFCDAWGSAAYHLDQTQALTEQIRTSRARIARRFKAMRFLVYFQAYTNTFTRADTLRRRLDIALAEPDVAGIVIGTRPDCLPRRTLEVLAEYAKRTYLMVELGSQSFSDDQLRFLRRGHDVAATEDACAKLAAIPGLDVALHLIFGLPGETEADAVHAAEAVNRLKPAAVKLHNLHVLRNTPLADLYAAGRFAPFDLPAYTHLVVAFLRRLHPEIAVQRLAATANRHDDLIAPDWTRLKMAPTQFIRDRLAELDARQGDSYTPDPSRGRPRGV